MLNIRMFMLNIGISGTPRRRRRRRRKRLGINGLVNLSR
jgi:hypothetical protein